MSLWRIKLAIPDDPRSLELFTEALAGQPVSLVRLAPDGIDPDGGVAGMTGEVLVDLGTDEGLAAMLSALHGLSPQVFVSRADPADLPARAIRPVVTSVPQRRPAGPARSRKREMAERHLSQVVNR